MKKHLAVWIVWAIGIVTLIYYGNIHDGYSDLNRLPGEPVPAYPWLDVALFCLIMTAETCFLWVVLTLPPYHHYWARSLFGLIIVISVIPLFTLATLHAPSYRKVHLFWLLAVALILLIITIIAGLVAALSKYETPTAAKPMNPHGS